MSSKMHKPHVGCLGQLCDNVGIRKQPEIGLSYEPRHEKTGLLPMRKQRRRSAVQ